MHLDFTGRNFEVTAALKTFVQEKFQRLERHNDHISYIKVIFYIENLTHVAEAVIHVDGNEIHASAKDEDMYRAVDELTDKLNAQLIKHKEKNKE